MGVEWAECELPGSVDSVRWFGLGPAEAYPDSRRAARVGVFSAGVDELSVDYARPQETGHRPGMRWLELRQNGECALRIRSLPDRRGVRPGFTLSSYTAAELTAARHRYELPASSRRLLTVDAAQNGLGSASCGPGVRPDAVLRPGVHTITLLFDEPRDV